MKHIEAKASAQPRYTSSLRHTVSIEDAVTLDAVTSTTFGAVVLRAFAPGIRNLKLVVLLRSIIWKGDGQHHSQRWTEDD